MAMDGPSISKNGIKQVYQHNNEIAYHIGKLKVQMCLVLPVHSSSHTYGLVGALVRWWKEYMKTWDN